MTPAPRRPATDRDLLEQPGGLWDDDRRDALRAAIKDADLVAFDVFDTLLVRAVTRPVDAFRVAEELVNQRTRRLVLPGGADARVAAEAALRAEAAREGRSPDTVTLAAIWERAGAEAGYDAALAAVLLEMELEAERLLLRPAPAAAELLRFALEQGIDVVLVSDTYLPSAFVASVLAAHGLDGYRALMVSCEEGAAKSDGSLWARLVGRHPGARIVHVGDDPMADVVQPRAFGIETHHQCKPVTALRLMLGPAAALNGPALGERLDRDGFRLLNTQRSLLHAPSAHLAVAQPGVSAARACGYGALGPMLVGYVQWLHRAAVAGGHDHLFFLSRDGHIMQEAYRALLGPEALPSTYLAASRRLYNLAAITETLGVRDVDFLSQAASDISVGEFFSRLGLPEVEEGARALAARLNLDSAAPGRDHHAAVRACFWQLAGPLASAAVAERATLLAYWEQAGLLSARRPAVVDIGWHGSLERSMRRVLALAGVDRPLAGLYFGLHAVRGDEPPGAGAPAPQAFVDGGRAADRLVHHRLVWSSVAVLEFCFTRPEGTVVGLAPGPDGRLAPRHAADQMPVADRAVLADVQEGALAYVGDFAAATAALPGPVTRLERAAALEAMVLLVTEPTAAAADVFGRRRHGDGFGSGVTWEPIGAPEHGPEYYAGRPDALEEEARRASWKHGFAANAREMGLDLPDSLRALR